MATKIPAYKAIYNSIYDQILSGKYRPGDQLPIEMELCRIYNVSRITVQKALNLLVDENIISRTIGKGTFVNDASDKGQSKHSPLIGVVMCGVSSSFGIEILKSIEKNASSYGYSIVFKNSQYSRETEMKALHDLNDIGVVGCIIQPTHGEAVNSEIMNFALGKKPIVLIDRNLSGISCPFVGSDNYQATKRVMNELFSKGHRNVCFMCSDPNNTTTTMQRLEQFRNSYAANGIPFKDYFVYDKIRFSLSVNHIGSKMEQDFANVKQYILDHPDITCIFTLEYSICILVKQALKSLGTEYRRRICVVTFDFVSDPHVLSDICYVRQYEEEIGFQAVRLLVNSLHSKEENVKMYLPTELVNPDKITDLNEKGQ